MGYLCACEGPGYLLLGIEFDALPSPQLDIQLHICFKPGDYLCPHFSSLSFSSRAFRAPLPILFSKSTSIGEDMLPKVVN